MPRETSRAVPASEDPAGLLECAALPECRRARFRLRSFDSRLHDVRTTVFIKNRLLLLLRRSFCDCVDLAGYPINREARLQRYHGKDVEMIGREHASPREVIHIEQTTDAGCDS